MRVYATPGDTYAFAGAPTIDHIATCVKCLERGDRTHVFATAEARDAWARDHEENRPNHRVAVTTEVVACA